jgi:apolipoprotein N-acyltransferase
MAAAVRPAPALDAYEDLSVRFLAESKVDLLVWPEGAVDFALEHTRLADAFRAYVRLNTRVPGAPALLSGGLVQRRSLSDAENSAILIDENRRALGAYGKVNPMPFGEYLPLAGYFPFLRDYFPNSGSIARVERPGFLTFRGHRIQPRICYEEVLASETREAVLDNAPELFIDLVDDAWFGATPASSFHLAIARLRAIEHRRYLVRAVNDGPSAIIDARGRLQQVAPIREAATLAGSVRWLAAPTPFQRLGSWPAWLLALALVAWGRLTRGLSVRVRARPSERLRGESLRRSGRSA